MENLEIEDRLYFSIIESYSILITDNIYKQLSEQLPEKKKEFTDKEEFHFKFEASDKDFLISSMPMTFSIEILYRIYENKEVVNDLELNCVLHDLAIYKIPLAYLQKYSERKLQKHFSHTDL